MSSFQPALPTSLQRKLGLDVATKEEREMKREGETENERGRERGRERDREKKLLSRLEW